MKLFSASSRFALICSLLPIIWGPRVGLATASSDVATTASYLVDAFSQGLAGLQTSSSFTSSINSMTERANSYLAALGPVMSLTLSLALPMYPSPEVDYMVHMMRYAMRGIDQIELMLMSVDDIWAWSEVHNMLDYEVQISVLHYEMTNIYSCPDQTQCIQRYLHLYDRMFQAPTAFYHALMQPSGSTNTKFFDGAAEFLRNDATYFRELAFTAMSLMVKAAVVDIGRLYMQGSGDPANEVTAWQARLSKISDEILRVNQGL